MPPVPASAPHPLAAQLAQLLAGSDLDELREVVRRWVAQAPGPTQRCQYEQLGAKLLALKQALGEQPVPPTGAELELALTMMMSLAAQADPQVLRP